MVKKRKIELFIISLLLFALVFTSGSVNQAKAASYRINDLGTFPVIGSGYTTSGGFVEALQTVLWSSGYSSTVGAIDGYHGTSTANGIKSFQSKYGLTSDGIAGAATWKKMESVTYTEFKMYSTGAGAAYFSALVSKTNNSIIKSNKDMWMD